MNDREWAEKVSKAVDNRLSGLKGDPWLAQRVLMNAKEGEEETRKCAPRRHRLRFVLVMTLLLALLTAAAFAAAHWGIFDTLSFMLGSHPADEVRGMQKIQQRENVNGVEITIHEAGYDGRTLMIQYSFRMLDEPEAFGILDDTGALQEGIAFDALQKLSDHQVGWWADAFWINGQCIDMPGNSGAIQSGSLTPGEIIRTDYWRLDNAGVYLNGEVEIVLPIGEAQPVAYRQELLSKETGSYRVPTKGAVTFQLDTGDVSGQVTTLHPNVETITPELTAKTAETVFTPLMTYITLDLQVHPGGSEDLTGDMHSENEEAMEAVADFVSSLRLVDGEGREVFPNRFGNNGFSASWAEYVYPALESVPEELWLAPLDGDEADMTCAIRVK